MATGILRIQAFAARQSSPVEGVTVTITGDGFTVTRRTDAEGSAGDVTLTPGLRPLTGRKQHHHPPLRGVRPDRL